MDIDLFIQKILSALSRVQISYEITTHTLNEKESQVRIRFNKCYLKKLDNNNN